MTILVAYDGSADARAAIEFAAKHLTAEPAVIVTVWEPLLVQLKKYPLAAGGHRPRHRGRGARPGGAARQGGR
ncbi:universal stress protein [Nonomuraea salmonea]|uniref:universal stress protein n=1 Tax=Nonomuraea salmonea TaxID=46181 RepID=UPI0031E744CB